MERSREPAPRAISRRSPLGPVNPFSGTGSWSSSCVDGKASRWRLAWASPASWSSGPCKSRPTGLGCHLAPDRALAMTTDDQRALIDPSSAVAQNERTEPSLSSFARQLHLLSTAATCRHSVHTLVPWPTSNLLGLTLTGSHQRLQGGLSRHSLRGVRIAHARNIWLPQ